MTTQARVDRGARRAALGHAIFAEVDRLNGLRDEFDKPLPDTVDGRLHLMRRRLDHILDAHAEGVPLESTVLRAAGEMAGWAEQLMKDAQR